jgi:divalent metal cation (Fe/Co/Zn/Cd) transporter
MPAECAVCECAVQSCKSCTSDACSVSNCYSCCCVGDHSAWRQKRIREGLNLQYISIVWMVVEIVGAMGAAILASSFALLAFGADSIIELVSAVTVMRHLSVDGSGSREGGENTALLTSLLLVALVPAIGLGATYAYFFANLHPATSLLGIAVALGSVIVMPVLWLKKRRIGQDTACIPLSIDAVESATCFFMAIALLGGLALEFIFKLGWIDYAAALVIVGFVAYEAKESLTEVLRKPALNL